jgi:hypothetical protein
LCFFASIFALIPGGGKLRARFPIQRIRGLLLASFSLAAAFFVQFHTTPAAAFCFGHLPCSTTTGAPLLSVQSIGYAAQATAQVALTGIQQQIWSTEDRVQCLIRYTDPNASRPIFCQPRPPDATRPIAFTEDEAPAGDPVINAAFAALGYSGKSGASQSPIVFKAPPSAPAPSTTSYSAWGQGSVDDEVRTGTYAGTNIGSKTVTWAGVGGADVTFLRLTSGSDALVFGLLSGDTTASVNNADGSLVRINGPSVGAYSAYVNGGFSADGTFKTDFLNIEDVVSGGGLPLGMYNYAAVGNVNYKQAVGSWWYQPTAGFTYTRSVWNEESKSIGMNDGTNVRVQGGARFGSGFDWAGIHFSNTLTLLAYDDVLITGGTLAVVTGTPLAPTNEGKVFGQVIGNLEAQLTKNWSASFEGEFRGSTDVYGLAGRVTITYNFN